MRNLPYPVQQHTQPEESQPSPHQVSAFGMILYTDSHPHIKKVLADDDYWKSLDDISGPKWPIFSIRPKPGEYRMPKLPDGSMGFMKPIWAEPNENKLLLDKFGLESTEDFPALVVYCVAADQELLVQSLKLEGESVETAYASLAEAVKVCTRAIEGIAAHNHDNAAGISAALELHISSHKSWKRLKKTINFYSLLKGLRP